MQKDKQLSKKIKRSVVGSRF